MKKLPHPFMLIRGPKGLARTTTSPAKSSVRSAKKLRTQQPPSAKRRAASAKSECRLADDARQAEESRVVVTAAKTVGILDLGAWLSGLPALLETLNGSQTDFQFFEVKAPIPAGLIKTKEHLVDWMESRCGRLSDDERQQISRNMLADEFFVAAEDIRRSLHIDYIAGITAPMIAGIAGRHAYWNHLASSRDKAVVISTADLRKFSKQAGRPFEVAVGVLLIAHLMCNFNSRVNIHPESRGCIFDYFGDRVGLIPVLQKPTIDDRCRRLIKPRYRGSAVAMLDALARVGGRHSSRRGQRNARDTTSVSAKKRNLTRR